MTLSDPLLSRLSAALSGDSRNLPLYRRLATALSEVLAAPGVEDTPTLPSERALSSALGISRVTVRRALDDLARDVRLRRRQGARTTVALRVEKALSALTGFSDELRGRGALPGQRWLARQTVLPIPSEAMALQLSPGDPIVRLIRVRTADGQPLAIERAAVPQAILPSGDLVEDSLYAALSALGAAPVRGAQRIRAGVMSRAEAELLASDPGSPLLIVERRCFLADGRPVEFTETRYNGERYDFLTELGP